MQTKTRATRDLTKAQFLAALKRNGMESSCFGYIQVGGGLSVYRHNGGERYRDQLAYLIRARDQHFAREAEELARAHAEIADAMQVSA